jgi:predicted HTH domain antitoxin
LRQPTEFEEHIAIKLEAPQPLLLQICNTTDDRAAHSLPTIPLCYHSIMNRSIHIEYPSTLPDALQKTPAEFEREARLAMAVKLFEMKRLSSGQAALLAGIDRTTFLMQLSEQGVAMVDLPPEELVDDVRHAGSK